MNGLLAMIEKYESSYVDGVQPRGRVSQLASEYKLSAAYVVGILKQSENYVSSKYPEQEG